LNFKYYELMIDFSIIIPTFNDEKKIERALKSVISQDLSNWELIIIDDGSTDNTKQKVQPYLGNPKIKYFKQSNSGVGIARNLGVQYSTGEFIIFLDSDDEAKPELLSDFRDVIDISPNVGFMSCGLRLLGEEKLPRLQPGISTFKYSVIPGSFSIKREVFDGIGGYDPNLKQSENWEMTARALKYCVDKNLKIKSINNCNLIYHHHKTPEQTRIRDEHRARATFYLYEKYTESGVLHFKKDDFLVSSAVNYTRAGNFKKARRIFYKILKEKPSLANLLRLVVFEIPFLRRKKWMRKG